MVFSEAAIMAEELTKSEEREQEREVGLGRQGMSIIFRYMRLGCRVSPLGYAARCA